MSALAVLLVAAFVTGLVDQASKAFVTARLQPGAFHALLGPLGLRRVESAAAGYTRLSRNSLLAMALVLVLFVVGLLWTQRALPIWAAVGLGLLVGAALSNLLDRLVRGRVVDFIAVRGWRTFNLADAAMVAGAVLTWSAL